MGNGNQVSRRERKRLAAEAAKKAEVEKAEVPETTEPIVDGDTEVQTVPAAPVVDEVVEETEEGDTEVETVPAPPVVEETPEPEVEAPASILVSMKNMCDVEFDKTVWNRPLAGQFVAGFLDTFTGILESEQLTYGDIAWFKEVLNEENYSAAVLGIFSDVTVEHIGTVVYLKDKFDGKDVSGRACPFDEANLHML